MSSNLKGASAEVGRYANIAARYCEKKHGKVDGNEMIFAAILIAMTIRDCADDLTNAFEEITNAINNADFTADLSGVESAIEEVVKAVDGVADHF